MKKVNLFIVGEPKCGTTALHGLLAQHPDIHMSRYKEPRYFATDLMRESDAYHGSQRLYPVRTEQQFMKLFSDAGAERVLGESSTNYLFSREAAANIHRYNPDARIIAIFRNPVDFAFSWHQQLVSNLHEDEPDFAKALELEPERRQGRSLPRHAGTPSYLYYGQQMAFAQHLTRFLGLFAPDRIKVLIYEEFRQDNATVFREVLDFLGVDPAFVPEFSIRNPTTTARFPTIGVWFRSAGFWKAARPLIPLRMYGPLYDMYLSIFSVREDRGQMDEALRQHLMRQLRPGVEQLQKLVGRDLVTLWGYAGH